MTIVYTRRAVADIIAIADYIREHRPAASVRVADAITATVAHLAENPKLGMDRIDLGVRKIGVRRYSYSIYYKLRGEMIEIVHVRDDRRKPLEPGDV